MQVINIHFKPTSGHFSNKKHKIFQIKVRNKVRLSKKIGFTFSTVTFELVEIKECAVPQNKRLNLLNLKDFMLFYAKMAGRGRK